MYRFDILYKPLYLYRSVYEIDLYRLFYTGRNGNFASIKFIKIIFTIILSLVPRHIGSNLNRTETYGGRTCNGQKPVTPVIGKLEPWQTAAGTEMNSNNTGEVRTFITIKIILYDEVKCYEA